MPRSTLTRRQPQKDRRKHSARERGYGRWWSNERRTGAADVEFARVIIESGDPWCRICRVNPAELMDHIVAPSTAGEPGSENYERLLRDPKNWQPACGRCNRIKGSKGMDHPTVKALRGDCDETFACMGK